MIRTGLVMLCLLLGVSLSAQESKKVSMKLTYKGAPLCYWDVTIKHGDMTLKQGKTDENGFVDFGYVSLYSYAVDAYGYKKTANGEKSWDVKGYITLNENGHVDFDFQQLVEETGMGSMIESAWGLTLNDCGSGGASGGTGTSGTTSSQTTGETENTSTGTETKSTLEQWNEESAAKEEERKQEQAQRDADWESGKTTAEGYQNQRAMYINQIKNCDAKIVKKTDERNGVKADSKEYSELSYEIKDLEIEKEITQLKLEKVEKEIAKGNVPLEKSEREYYKAKEDDLKEQQRILKEKRDSGVRINENEQENNGAGKEQNGSEENDTKSNGTEENNIEEEEEFEKFVVYTAEEFAAMSTINLQKLKLEYSAKLGKRKTVLKAKGSIMKTEKLALLQDEIYSVEKMIELMDSELAKRKDK